MKSASFSMLATCLTLGCGGGTTPSPDAASVQDAAVLDSGGTLDAGDLVDTRSVPDAGLCATTLTPLPVAVYAMLDQSSSMLDPAGSGGSKWDALTQAIDAHLGGPGASAAFGLQYFGLPATGTCPTTCLADVDCGACGPCLSGFCIGALGDSCTAADYAAPEIAIGPTASVASGVHASLALHAPSTSTPTSAALQGAVDYAATYASTHGSEDVVAVLITDGDPSECDTNLSNVDAIATSARTGAQRISTAVLSLGAGASFADGLAAAGGTGAARTPDLSAAASAHIATALDTIVAARCALPLLAGTDPATLMLRSHDGVTIQDLPRRADAAACGTSSGYVLDDETAPRRALLCPTSCAALRASGTQIIEQLTSC